MMKLLLLLLLLLLQGEVNILVMHRTASEMNELLTPA